MIVITGAAGFIASCLVKELAESGYGKKLILVDDFSREDKLPNHQAYTGVLKIERTEFLSWFKLNGFEVDFVYHLGARTDTTEQNEAIFDELNLNYSKDIFKICASFAIPLIYASSAATYGLGTHGYSDDHATCKDLQPLNPYGWSKQNFDLWVLDQLETPPLWAGLKFFNVYGPNEYHKGRMASVIFHTYHKIVNEGSMQLFRSHKPEFVDGGQSRDFIYVKDVVSILLFFINSSSINSGIYNVGTGKARSFYDLASSTFNAMGKEVNISFIDTPEDIRETYQYYTQAEMFKLVNQGYNKGFYTLEDGIKDYVTNYLMKNAYF
jgi:ADP-L-glycero-D-manno-heptose 6-epimerase